MLVLLDGAAVPPDVSKIPVMSVDVFLAPASSNPLPDDPSDIYGTIQPHETLWEHFNCQTQQGAASDNIGIFLEAYRPKISHSHQDDRKDSKRIMRLQTNLSDSWNVTTQVGNPEDFVASTTSTARAAAAASTAKTKKASAPKSDKVLDHGSGVNGSVGTHRVEIPSKNSVQAKKKPPPSTSQGKKEDEKSAGDKRGTSTGPGSAKSVKKPKAATSGAKGKPKMYGFDAAEMQALEEAFDEVEEAAKKAKAVPVDDDGDETDVQETPKKARSAKKK
jgi:hypothetical protein